MGWLEHPYLIQNASPLLGRRPAPVDAAVVLGTGRHPASGPDRGSEWTDGDRFFGGLEALQQLRSIGQMPRLIFTGAAGGPASR